MTSTPTRIVVTGKGGVGKTTVTATIARLLARAGQNVLAVDGDAQCNLALTLGVPPEEARSLLPVALDTGYADQVVGLSGGLVRLNPDVTDVVERFAVSGPDGVRVLVMGGLVAAGGGCLCPEHSVLASTVAQVSKEDADVVLLDTQAGVEHFGRALARGFDAALVLSDPSTNAGDVARQTAGLARELGLPRVSLVVNRTRAHNRPRWLTRSVEAEFDDVHALPYDDVVLETEPSVEALLHMRSGFTPAVELLMLSLLAAPVTLSP